MIINQTKSQTMSKRTKNKSNNKQTNKRQTRPQRTLRLNMPAKNNGISKKCRININQMIQENEYIFFK